MNITPEWLDSKFREVEDLQNKWESIANPKNKFVKFLNWTFRRGELFEIHSLAQKKLDDICSGKILDEFN